MSNTPEQFAALILAPTRGLAPGIYDSVNWLLTPQRGSLRVHFLIRPLAGSSHVFSFFVVMASLPPMAHISSSHGRPIQKNDQEIVTGILRFVGESAVLKLPKQAHGGCWNVNPELDRGEEMIFTFETRKAWREERMIKDQKVWFYSRPDLSAKTAS
jgi:hypothetical protein